VPILGNVLAVIKSLCFIMYCLLIIVYFLFYLRSRMPRGQWSEENLKLAVRSVLVDGLPKKAAARIYGIPRPTLQ